jgi:hypothetical protein
LLAAALRYCKAQDRPKRVVSFVISARHQREVGVGGTEAHQRAVHEHLNGGRWQLIAEITEIDAA